MARFEKFSKSNDPTVKAVGPKPYFIPETLGFRGCRCDLGERYGLPDLRYTGEVRRINKRVIAGIHTCTHGNVWLRQKLSLTTNPATDTMMP